MGSPPSTLTHLMMKLQDFGGKPQILRRFWKKYLHGPDMPEKCVSEARNFDFFDFSVFFVLPSQLTPPRKSIKTLLFGLWHFLAWRIRWNHSGTSEIPEKSISDVRDFSENRKKSKKWNSPNLPDVRNWLFLCLRKSGVHFSDSQTSKPYESQFVLKKIVSTRSWDFFFKLTAHSCGRPL